MCVRLEEDGPVVEEFELSLWLAAGRDFCRGTTLVTTAQLDDLLSAPLPGGGGVTLCCVHLFVWCVRFGALCMIASSSYMT